MLMVVVAQTRGRDNVNKIEMILMGGVTKNKVIVKRNVRVNGVNVVPTKKYKKLMNNNCFQSKLTKIFWDIGCVPFILST